MSSEYNCAVACWVEVHNILDIVCQHELVLDQKVFADKLVVQSAPSWCVDINVQHTNGIKDINQLSL